MNIIVYRTLSPGITDSWIAIDIRRWRGIDSFMKPTSCHKWTWTGLLEAIFELCLCSQTPRGDGDCLTVVKQKCFHCNISLLQDYKSTSFVSGYSQTLPWWNDISTDGHFKTSNMSVGPFGVRSALSLPRVIAVLMFTLDTKSVLSRLSSSQPKPV